VGIPEFFIVVPLLKARKFDPLFAGTPKLPPAFKIAPPCPSTGPEKVTPEYEDVNGNTSMNDVGAVPASSNVMKMSATAPTGRSNSKKNTMQVKRNFFMGTPPSKQNGKGLCLPFQKPFCDVSRATFKPFF
jgi:hypothetical protein